MTFKLVWHSPHACGDLPGEFATEAEAEAAGEYWHNGMVALEQTPEGREQAEEDYGWEVVEVEA